MVDAEARISHLSAFRTGLEDAAAALAAEVRQASADELDRARQVRGNLLFDLGVGDLLGGAEQAIAGIAEHDVDTPGGEGQIHPAPDRARVVEVERDGAQPVAMRSLQITERLRAPHRRDDAVPPQEQPLRHAASDARRCSRHEPRRHSLSP